nr:copia protein [Tanacetum cinerariifolium]
MQKSRNQESMPRNEDSSRKIVNVEDTSSKAMVAIDGSGFDWSYMADDEATTNMALMAFSDSKSFDKLIGSQIFDNSRTGLGFTSYNAVAPPPTCLFAPLTIDLSNSGLEEFQHPEFKGYGPKDIPISTARQSSSRAAAPVSAARPINTAAPKPLVNVAKPRQNALQKSHSLCRRPFYEQTTLKNKNLNNKVNTGKVNSVNTAKGNRLTSVVRKQGINGDPQDALKDQGYFDSGYSRHMTRNISYLTNFKDQDGGYVVFGEGAKGGKITRKGIIRTGGGPKWLFDIDALSESMNYAPVPIGTNSNDFAGKGASFDAERPNAESNTKTVNTAGPVNTATPTYTHYLSNPLMPDLGDTGIFDDAYDDRDEGAEADYNNLETVISVSPIPSTRIHKDHPKEQIIGRSYAGRASPVQATKCLDTGGSTSWKKIHWNQIGIDYDEVFAPVAQIESVRLFLAYASFMDFIVYQMDVKSAFLYGTIEQEVYVRQTLGFVDPEFLKECTRWKKLYMVFIKLLEPVKRIFRYLKGQPTLGLWYPKDSALELIAYFDSDYAGASLDKKSTI